MEITQRLRLVGKGMQGIVGPGIIEEAALEVERLRTRTAELEAAIRAILAINEKTTLCDDYDGELGPQQSMELAKTMDTAECLVGWQQ